MNGGRAAIASAATSALPSEVARFDRLSETWWDPAGPMRPLHVVNALRFDYLCELVAERFPGRRGGRLADLRVLDIGCGAGLLCEPFAHRRACVTGIDAASRNIAAARLHAERGGLSIDYRVGEPRSALRAEERFDLVTVLEVVEHVADVAAFLAAAAHHVAPGGLLVASTIDRTLKSYLFAIVGAEYLLRVLPRGTHDWRRFVRPAELEDAAARAGLVPVARRGIRYLPVVHRAAWTRDTSVNYLAAFARPSASSPA
jgi:2-polyprenyl-6-hydroxyphenyl methylase/3-demethylubiquinone-9 3-methyltransferase